MRLLLAGAALSVAASCAAQGTAPLSATRAVIRVWGHGHRGRDYALTLLTAWETAFKASHPGVSFDNQLDGNASAMGGLWTGASDLALLDREASFIEVDGYQQGTGHDPFGVAVASGSVSTADHAPALQIYVNTANPVRQLTVGQLDAIFDADHRRGPHRARTWGELGVEGAWAAKPVHLYSLPIQSATVQFFERAAMKGSQKFSNTLTIEPTNKAIAAVVRHDKEALAIIDADAPGLKALPLVNGQGPAVEATPESIVAGTYPLARRLYIYVDRPKGGPLSPEVEAFLNFVLSDRGQEIVRHTGGYLPLPTAAAAASREALR